MRGVDLALVLAALLVLGLAAATLAFMQASDDRVRLTFEEASSPLAEASADGVGEGGARLNWTLPANATSASMGILVTFTGQAFTGGTATVQAQLWGPDGTGGPVERLPFPIGQGATSGQVNFTLELRWMEPPRNTTVDSDGFDRGVAWNAPLELVVVVQEPGDLPAASYAFAVRAAGQATAYRHLEA